MSIVRVVLVLGTAFGAMWGVAECAAATARGEGDPIAQLAFHVVLGTTAVVALAGASSAVPRLRPRRAELACAASAFGVAPGLPHLGPPAGTVRLSLATLTDFLLSPLQGWAKRRNFP